MSCLSILKFFFNSKYNNYIFPAIIRVLTKIVSVLSQIRCRSHIGRDLLIKELLVKNY